MKFSVLHAILDVDVAGRAGRSARELVAAFLDGGAELIQVRAKHLPSGPFLDLCDEVVRAAGAYGAAVVVNDRADLARIAGAAGVHVGQEDLPPKAARQLLGDGALVGYSTHSVEQIDAALTEPISYVAVGPVFGTRTKDTGYDPVGLDLVAAAKARAGGLPVVAIGGITLATAPAVLAAGASAVAVISDLLTGGDPALRIRAYLRALSVAGGL